jgi:diguanylate cyclase (GGDEF)-like protein/putative nucleotidyltransferase with HDIG domain
MWGESQMGRKEQIAKKFLFIRRLFIILILFTIFFVSIREITIFLSSVSYFESELLKYRQNEIELEIENRQDEIKSIKQTIEEQFYHELKHEILQIDFFAQENVDSLDSSATLLEKRNEYVDTIYQYDLVQDEYLFFAISLEGESWLMGLDKTDEHTDISFLQDPVDGSYFVLEMIDIIENSETNDGYITYHWPKVLGGDPIEKTSYLYYNEDVDLFIGTGLYLDDYQNNIITELAQRIEDYYANTDDHFFIIGYDQTVYAHTEQPHHGNDMISLKDSEGNDFHSSVVTALEESNSLWITIVEELENGTTEEYQTYIESVPEWNMYIGKSLDSRVIDILNQEYTRNAFISAAFTIFILTGSLSALVVLIRKNMNQNFESIQEEFQEQAEEIRRVSLIDSLTGLYNRKYFEIALSKIMNNPYKHLNIIMGDANGLKLTNDAYGHDFGDKLLIEIASILSQVFENAYLFRWGGDEFLILLQDQSEESIEERVSAFHAIAKNRSVDRIIISISFGWAVCEKEDDPYKTINLAERSMYEAKTLESTSTKRSIIDNILNSLYGSFNFEQAHSENVKSYALLLASKLDFNQLEMNRLRLGALMHDVGKIGLPDYIVTKPDKLTDEEYAEIKKHPEKGFRILSAYPELSEYGYIALHHHEKYDGSGYPKGLKGEEIPLNSRIITIADAFDAMTGDRVYRKRMTKKQAIAELIRCKGSHFDPTLVDLFVEALEQKK